MTAATVSLVMQDRDSVTLLRRALEQSLTFHSTMVVTSTNTAARELVEKRPAEARRHERRAAEFKRRQALLTQLLDQLPTDNSGLPQAPMGER